MVPCDVQLSSMSLSTSPPWGDPSGTTIPAQAFTITGHFTLQLINYFSLYYSMSVNTYHLSADLPKILMCWVGKQLLSREECFSRANFTKGQFISEYFHVKMSLAPLHTMTWP